MPIDLVVADNPPRASHIQTDSENTDFGFNFPLTDASHLRVAVDGARLDSGDFSLQTGMTLPAESGAVTLLAAPTTGARVVIWRHLPIERQDDFLEDGAFRSSALNSELDRFAMILQQVEQRFEDTIRRSPSDVDMSLTIPTKEARAGKVMSFSSDGGIPSGLDEPVGDNSAATSAAAAAQADASAITADNAASAIVNAAEAALNLSDLTDTDAARASLDAYSTSEVSLQAAASLQTDDQARHGAAWNGLRLAAQEGFARFNLVDGYVDDFKDSSGLDLTASNGHTFDEGGDFVSNTFVAATTISAADWPGASGSLANSTDGTYTWKEINSASNNGAYKTTLPAYVDHLGEDRVGWQWGGNSNFTGMHYYLDGTSGLIDFTSVTSFEIEWAMRVRGDSNFGGRHVHLLVHPDADHYFGLLWYGFTETDGVIDNSTRFEVTGFPSGPSDYLAHNQWHDLKMVVENWDNDAKTLDLSVFADGVLQEKKTGLSAYYSASSRPASTTLMRFGKHTDNQSGEYVEVDRFSFFVPDESAATSMTLISEPTTADAVPDEGHFIVQIEETDSIALGEDIVLSISRDDGTTWTVGTVSALGLSGDGNTVAVAICDLSSQPSGTAMRLKIETPTQQRLRIHGIALLWS